MEVMGASLGLSFHGSGIAFTLLPFPFWAECRQLWDLREQWSLKVEGISGPE